MSYQIRTWVTSRKGSRNRKEIVFQRNKHKRKEIINKNSPKNNLLSKSVLLQYLQNNLKALTIKQRRPCSTRYCLLPRARLAFTSDKTTDSYQLRVLPVPVLSVLQRTFQCIDLSTPHNNSGRQGDGTVNLAWHLWTTLKPREFRDVLNGTQSAELELTPVFWLQVQGTSIPWHCLTWEVRSDSYCSSIQQTLKHLFWATHRPPPCLQNSWWRKQTRKKNWNRMGNKQENRAKGLLSYRKTDQERRGTVREDLRKQKCERLKMSCN